jgi:N-acetylmuramoyl-L-alanine amidase
MNRLRARLSSLVVSLALLVPVAAPAQSAPAAFWFDGAPLTFDRAAAMNGDVAVGIRDAGLQRFLGRVGATIAYGAQQRYVVITANDRRTVAFVIGDARYTAGGSAMRAPFAPFVQNGDVELPFIALARALYVEPVDIPGQTILEPQLGVMDVRPDGRRTIVTLHAATPIASHTIVDQNDRLQVAFDGVGTTLLPARKIGGPINEIDVFATGNARTPTATVTFAGAPGTLHQIASASPYEFTVVFGPPGVSLDPRLASGAPSYARGAESQAAPAAIAAQPQTSAPQPGASDVPPVGGPPGSSAPTPASAPAAETMPAESPASANGPAGSAAPAVVTGVTFAPAEDAFSVRLAISGGAAYTWHRLLDDRWYLDLANATLTDAGRDERPESALVASVRIRQIGTPDAPVVRIAFTLKGDRRVEAAPSGDGLTIAVSAAPADVALRAGAGSVGGATVAQTAVPAPIGEPPPLEGPWKFGGGPPAAALPVSGSRVIVLDPGHGGGDIGTAHNGLIEKLVTLDIARRVRALLAAQGWIVKMTRDSDIDPFNPALLPAMQTDGLPNASDRAYLQTRCNVANDANARVFVSIHVNYSPSTAPSGTTFYYTKPQDVALAQALERAVIPAAGTADDGVVHANYYVTKHTTMPAVLIETAFISNAADAARLADPTWLAAMARGIAGGIDAYSRLRPQTSRADQ